MSYSFHINRFIRRNHFSPWFRRASKLAPRVETKCGGKSRAMTMAKTKRLTNACLETTLYAQFHPKPYLDRRRRRRGNVSVAGNC